MTLTVDEALAELLHDKGFTVAVAESLTGGLLSDSFAKMEGASKVFRGGLVAYSADVKRNLLGIGDAHVVSEAAALSMATGVAQLLGADLGVSVTGVGGPGPEDGVEAGTVWMAIHTPGETKATLHHFDGEPGAVIAKARRTALETLYESLKS